MDGPIQPTIDEGDASGSGTWRQSAWKLILVLVLLGLLALVIWASIYGWGAIWQKLKTIMIRPGPAPEFEVFGVEFPKERYTAYLDTDFTLEPVTGKFRHKNAYMSPSFLLSQLPQGVKLATQSQVQAEVWKGLQCPRWGLCLSDDGLQLIGVTPWQCSVNPDGSYRSQAPVNPRLDLITSRVAGSLPDVLWLYGVKPASDVALHWKDEDIDLEGHKVLPWYQRCVGEPSSTKEVWSRPGSGSRWTGRLLGDASITWPLMVCSATPERDVSAPPAGSVVPSVCTDQKYLAPDASSPHGAGVVLSSAVTLWQLTPEGYLVVQNRDPTNSNSVIPYQGYGALAVPDVGESYAVVLVGSSPVSVSPSSSSSTAPTPFFQFDLQISKEGCGVAHTCTVSGATPMTVKADGTVVLKNRPSWGLALGPSVGSPAGVAPVLILTQDASRWLTFETLPWQHF